ncbi:uncharacterized protein At3g06530 [Curcuma longa]|uniref:uncharacterized protein At3g06530 n=1 Tax=Curcuma longa TaxID=136217 RepID=UPI003D9DBBB4
MSSVAAELQAIRAAAKVAPVAKVRPSVLFDHRTASDIDLRTILPIALSGLDVLIESDGRFNRYKDTLFSQTSLELDREKMVPAEEAKVNKSICWYLQLLSGYLQLHPALKTLEYLIRRYLVHVYNIDELILCALPFHDTVTFVRIVQLLELGNSKWMFLEGVKVSGAPLPRKVIMQQCLRDKGLLETLCNYASPTKEFQPSRPVVCFSTAVTIEALGAIPKLETDTVQRVLMFVLNGLNPAMRGNHDHKAGALMVIGLLATRATLAAKLIQSLMSSILQMAQHDANKPVDLPWLRTIIIALVTLVQSQSIQMLPKKAVMVLQKIRDFPGVLAGLNNEFNVRSFLHIYIESLVEYSLYEDTLLETLEVAVEVLPVKDLIEILVPKILARCMKLLQKVDSPDLNLAGNWGRKILIVLAKHYKCELSGAIRRFLEDSKMNAKEEENISQRLCLMFDDTLDRPTEISDSKLWFSLEHPKAVVRQTALENIAASAMLKTMSTDEQKLVNVQDAIMRALHDEDLNVVRAALSIDGMARIASPSQLLDKYNDILSRCTDVIERDASRTSVACDVAISCLERLVQEFQLEHLNCTKEIAKMFFPLFLVRPKTWRVNLKALQLVKELKWPYFDAIGQTIIDSDHMKSYRSDHAASINLRTIKALAEVFVASPPEKIEWLIECNRYNGLSKSVFFFIILQALNIVNGESGSPMKIYRTCFYALKNEWHEIEHSGGPTSEELNLHRCDDYYIELVNQLFTADVGILNRNLLLCIFWSLLRSLNEAANHNKLEDSSESFNIMDELFLFFVTSSHRKLFSDHLKFLLVNCCKVPFEFLSKYFAEEGYKKEVQIQSLQLFEMICSIFASAERTNSDENNYLQALVEFPSLLVPLANHDKDVRTSALHCIEEFYKMYDSSRFDASQSKYGDGIFLSMSLSLPTFWDFVEALVNEKTLISLDINFLHSYLTSMLSSSSNDLLAPNSSQKRFVPTEKEAILLYILQSALKGSSYRKLMILSLFKGMGASLLSVGAVKSLLFELMEKYSQHDTGAHSLQKKLSKNEIQLLCLLLEICSPLSSSIYLDSDIIDYLLRALRMDDLASDDPAVLAPCLMVLRMIDSTFYENLKRELQDELLWNLVILFRSDNGDLRNASRDALLRLNINCLSIVSLLESIHLQDHKLVPSKRFKRNKHPTEYASALHQAALSTQESRLSVLMSLLDILLLKKNLSERTSLVKPLFKVLEELFYDNWCDDVTTSVYQARHAILLVLKDITDSLSSNPTLADYTFTHVNIGLLVQIARSTIDVTTRNHAFLLLSSITKVSSGWISEHISDVFAAIGESALKQNDSHSQHVLEDLISTMVPCWMSKAKSIDKLLQIFIRALPEVAESRRLTLMVYLLRVLQEERSLGILIFHLFHSLVLRLTKIPESRRNLNDFFSVATLSEWEYSFAVEICSQYSCQIWFPCLVKLFKLGAHNEEEFLFQLHLIMQFTLLKLQDPKLLFDLEAMEDVGYLQTTLGALMQEVVLHLQRIRDKRKMNNIASDRIKGLKRSADKILNLTANWMAPSTFFISITKLLKNTDNNVKKQTLGLLCEIVKNQNSVLKKRKEKQSQLSLPPVIGEDVKPFFDNLCSKIVQLIDGDLDTSDTRVKLAAVSSVEALCKKYPAENAVFETCLATIVKYIGFDDLALSSGCIQAAGILVSVLGSKALPQLPFIMKNIMKQSHEISSCPIMEDENRHKMTLGGDFDNKSSMLLSVLNTLEAVINELGGALNPYLSDILDLIVLRPEYALSVDSKIKMKADAVRKLLVVTVPARLVLKPLLQIYSSALECGEWSLSLVFRMLSDMISSMDRPAIGKYHVKIYEHCLIALDLRRQLPKSIKNINMVEQSVIQAMIKLSMKLSEPMFNPLFLHSLEWADLKLEECDLVKTGSLNRNISFYYLVNELLTHQRSIFVPYFKHLLGGCVRCLTDTQDVNAPLVKKRKMTNGAAAVVSRYDEFLSLEQWHLKAVILKSLYKCFLYDTDRKLLDSTNFQVLLKPITYQLVVEPPKLLEQHSQVPTVDEVDESLVMCLGQMAVTARSDVLLKPLNHEVLMQTRSEKTRPKMLGLRIVKYLVERLKEEYLVLLPETIPFLGELLEDVELPVKTLAQQILKEMETLSGESLQQYL